MDEKIDVWLTDERKGREADDALVDALAAARTRELQKRRRAQRRGLAALAAFWILFALVVWAIRSALA